MYDYYFTFRSMTRAQQAALELNQYGVDAQYLRAPRFISVMGCGYAVRVSQSNAHRAAAVLRLLGTKQERVFRANSDGHFTEVYV